MEVPFINKTDEFGSPAELAEERRGGEEAEND